MITQMHEIAPNIHVSDYVIDGILYCGKCNTQKQYHITKGFLAGQTVDCMCECEAEEYRLEQKRMEEQKRKERNHEEDEYEFY